MPPDGSPVYAGFGVRLAAWAIDTLALAVIGFAAGAILGAVAELAGGRVNSGDRLMIDLLGLILSFAYYTLLTASPRRATIGKHLMGLVVVDEGGRRLDRARAAGRWIGTVLSALILLIGYLMIALDPRRRALHDRLARTYVVRREPFDRRAWDG
jgi:uncharacterized RDD family membrane protein YckC